MDNNQPLSPKPDWIERPDLLAQFERLLNSGKRLLVIETVADPGNGKTTLLSQLYWRLEKQGKLKPVWLTVNRFLIPKPEKDAHSYRTLETELLVFRDLLGLLLAGLNTKASHDFINFVQQEIDKTFLSIQKQRTPVTIRTGDIHISGTATNSKLTTGKVIFNAEGEYMDILATNLELLRDIISSGFKKYLIHQIGRKKHIFFIDNFEYVIISKNISNWFQRLLNNLDNVVIILARTITSEDLSENERIARFKLTPFSRDEVALYLNKRFGDLPGIDRLAERIYKFTHGHPGSFTLAVDTIVKDELADVDSLIKFFDRISSEIIPDDPHTSILEQSYKIMIEEILCDIREKDPDIERTLHAGTILNYYTNATIKDVLDPLQENESHSAKFYSATVDRLNRYSFVEQIDRKNGALAYRFQNFVRLCMEELLIDNDLPLHTALHKSACDYYSEKISEVKEKQGKKVYRSKYIFENFEWQENTNEWLFHLSAIQDRPVARLHFASVYFEAFNWWDWLLEFDYCTQLRGFWHDILDSRKSLKLPHDENDDKLLELLKDLEASYPKGYDKHNPERGNWQTARSTLFNLENLLDLNTRLTDLEPEARTIFGYLEWFIAQSYHFGNPPDFKKSEEHFSLSRNVFEIEKDLWNQIWTAGYMADLYLDEGKYAEAIAQVSPSLQIATTGEFESFDDQDHEVISQSYRVLGDAYWSDNDLKSAFQEYFRSAFHVFVFNVIPVDPDRYTTTLYDSVCKHIAKRIIELLNAGNKASALQAARYILDNWKPYWNQVGVIHDPADLNKLLKDKDIVALSNYLFPPSPVTREQIKRIIGLAEEMRGDIDKLETAPISANK